MSRRVIAALGVLAFAVSACSSSEPTRPVAKPGEIVTVLRGEPGHERALADWYSVALDKEGTLYAAELSDARAVKIPKSGHPSMIVDESTRFPPPPHPLPTGLSPLVYERMSSFQGIAVDGAGTVFLASPGQGEIVALTKSGRRRWVAGRGRTGNFALADGSPADVQLTVPSDLAFDRAGNLYILNGDSVARLGRDGMVRTVAGTNKQGFAGDGGPATAAQMTPLAMTVDPAGTIYIGDQFRVRRVDESGTIQTIAGTGEEGFSGDAGPALQAKFELIKGIALDGKGNVFVATGNRVREITADGVVHTIAGTGAEGYSGDGGPASQARLKHPNGLAVDNRGNLYIGDDLNFRIRTVKLTPSR